ncbi:MAG: hypothetical protein IT249_14365 [Chitinophagaceae bacterium]|nr:hypothetical protein [Chitinophagaceae bacterium]
MYNLQKFSKGLVAAGIFIAAGCNTTKVDAPPASVIIQKNINGRNDSWSFTGYGGGGAMFNAAVSPFSADNAFVACDMTGSFVTHNGGSSWRMFNLRGPVSFFVFDPSDSNIVYANSIALFKSVDRGDTWNVIYPSPQNIKGVVAKGDHASEVIINDDNRERKVLSLAVDPANSKKLYAVASVDTVISFISSMDGGYTWQQEKELEGEAEHIFINPASSENNRTIYIAGKHYIVCKENGIWKKNKLPAAVTTVTAYSGGFDKVANKFIIYAIAGKSYFNTSGEAPGIFYSEDAGITWQNRQDGLLKFNKAGGPLTEWRTIATSRFHPSTVYVSYNNIHISNDTVCMGVAKSDDYGKSWTLCWRDDITKNKNIPSANLKDGWLNERFGPTWGENPFSVGVSPSDPGVCYCTDFGRAIKTIDRGKHWQEVYSKKKEGGGWVSRGLEVTTGYGIMFDPFDSNHVYIANTDVGLMESHDGAMSWQSATYNNGIPQDWVNTTYWLTFDPSVKGKAWAVMSNTHDLPRPKMWRRHGVAGYKGGILMTEDAGKHWKIMSSKIGEAAFTHILLDTQNNHSSKTIYATAFGKGVYKSMDDGKTWQLKNKGIDGKEPFAWRLVKAPKGNRLYVIVSRRSEDGSIGNDMDGAVYYSEDGAESWKKLPLPAGTNAPTGLAVDQAHPDRLILSAWGRVVKDKFSPDTNGGIFTTNDHGKSWKAVLEKDQHIHDITYDERNNTYYACGFNSSAYHSVNNGETWERIKGYNFKWGKRVDPDPRDPGKIFIITFGGGVWYGPAAGFSPAVEDIVTPVLSYK